MTEEMKLRVSIERANKNIEHEIARVTSEFEKLKASADKIKSPEEFKKYSDDLKKTERYIADLRKAQDVTTVSLKKQTVSTKDAGVAMLNLQRIISDAPFGLVGISNNIEPLVASFLTLKKQTGGAFSALKAFLSLMLGPQGFIILVAAATAIAVKFGDEIVAAFTGANKHLKAFLDNFRKVSLYTVNDKSLEKAQQIFDLAKVKGNEKEIASAAKGLVKAYRDAIEKETIAQARISEDPLLKQINDELRDPNQKTTSYAKRGTIEYEFSEIYNEKKRAEYVNNKKALAELTLQEQALQAIREKGILGVDKVYLDVLKVRGIREDAEVERLKNLNGLTKDRIKNIDSLNKALRSLQYDQAFGGKASGFTKENQLGKVSGFGGVYPEFKKPLFNLTEFYLADREALEKEYQEFLMIYQTLAVQNPQKVKIPAELEFKPTEFQKALGGAIEFVPTSFGHNLTSEISRAGSIWKAQWGKIGKNIAGGFGSMLLNELARVGASKLIKGLLTMAFPGSGFVASLFTGQSFSSGTYNSPPGISKLHKDEFVFLPRGAAVTPAQRAKKIEAMADNVPLLTASLARMNTGSDNSELLNKLDKLGGVIVSGWNDKEVNMDTELTNRELYRQKTNQTDLILS